MNRSGGKRKRGSHARRMQSVGAAGMVATVASIGFLAISAGGGEVAYVQVEDLGRAAIPVKAGGEQVKEIDCSPRVSKIETDVRLQCGVTLDSGRQIVATAQARPETPGADDAEPAAEFSIATPAGGDSDAAADPAADAGY